VLVQSPGSERLVSENTKMQSPKPAFSPWTASQADAWAILTPPLHSHRNSQRFLTLAKSVEHTTEELRPLMGAISGPYHHVSQLKGRKLSTLPLFPSPHSRYRPELAPWLGLRLSLYLVCVWTLFNMQNWEEPQCALTRGRITYGQPQNGQYGNNKDDPTTDVNNGVCLRNSTHILFL
jgi:hypothetical protein